MASPTSSAPAAAKPAASTAPASRWPRPSSTATSFFPFADGLLVLADAGVTAVAQPGGSKRDDAVIAAADARDMAMVMMGERHFRH